MPRRSARIRQKVEEEQKDEEAFTSISPKQIPKSKLKPKRKCKKAKKQVNSTSTTNNISVSNMSQSDHDDNNNINNDPIRSDKENLSSIMNMDMDQKEQSESISAASSVDVTQDVKRLSLDTNMLPPHILLNNDRNDINIQPIKEVSREQSQDNDIQMGDVTDKNNDNDADADDENDDDNQFIDPDEHVVSNTIAAKRARRTTKPTISYKDASSSEEEDEDESDCNNPLFAGLSAKEKAAIKSRMQGMQTDFDESVKREREIKLNEIINSFDFELNEKVSMEEAGFIYDFCNKHQLVVSDKIEDEGDFFLMSMREMIEEKLKLAANGIRRNRQRNRKDNDSESEFDLAEYEDDDDDSEYFDEDDSDFEDPFADNDNLISSDDEYDNNNNNRRKRNKNAWLAKKGDYKCAGRLLLNDAMKDTTNFEGWSSARIQAWKNKEVNPNAYYYRFNDPGEEQMNGPVLGSEHKSFMERVMECGGNVKWGNFSKKIKGRVGYQCSNYWRQMMKDGYIKDPNYWIRDDGSFQFKRAKKGSIPNNVRAFSFVVLKDPSGVFSPLPAFHPKRPSDKILKKYLSVECKKLTEQQKKGGRRHTKKKRSTKNSNKNKKNDDKDSKDDNDDNDTTDNKEIVENINKDDKDKKKSKKSKKSTKKSKKSDKEEADDDDNDNDKKVKKQSKKKKKDSKKKNKSKKDKKSKKKGKKSKKDKKDKKKDKSKKKKDKKTSKKKKNKNKNKNDDADKVESDNKVAVNAEQSDNDKPKSRRTRGKKRKHSDDQPSEFEPPQKKRKISPSSNNNKNNKDNSDNSDNDKDDDMAILNNIIDIMTGARVIKAAISPYGHVMGYDSWCSILRNNKTKNTCPFTKQKLTRRSLIKLNETNINLYKDKIVNFTADDMKLLKS